MYNSIQTLFSPGIVLTNIIGDLESEEKGVRGMTMKEVSYWSTGITQQTGKEDIMKLTSGSLPISL